MQRAKKILISVSDFDSQYTILTVMLQFGFLPSVIPSTSMIEVHDISFNANVNPRINNNYQRAHHPSKCEQRHSAYSSHCKWHSKIVFSFCTAFPNCRNARSPFAMLLGESANHDQCWRPFLGEHHDHGRDTIIIVCP